MAESLSRSFRNPTKPDDTRDIAAREILALTLAAEAGIRVAQHRLLALGKQSVAVITRFDRDGTQRIAFLSAASLLGLPPDHPGAYTLVAAAIRQFGRDVPGDLRELWRRLIFSLLASNYDDHLRNHGFLMRDRSAKVSLISCPASHRFSGSQADENAHQNVHQKEVPSG
jgi:serine/threonine protein kinase HipA of HipAB toxin-antitoxin module